MDILTAFSLLWHRRRVGECYCFVWDTEEVILTPNLGLCNSRDRINAGIFSLAEGGQSTRIDDCEP